MEKTRHILAINVGSTSTKVAFYRDSERLVQESITYSAADLSRYEGLGEQLPLREEGLRKFIEKNAIDMSKVDLVISRGGLGRPGPAGAYSHRSGDVRRSPAGSIRQTPLGPGACDGPGAGAAIPHARRRDRPAEHRRVPTPGPCVGAARDRTEKRLSRPQPEGRRAKGGRADERALRGRQLRRCPPRRRHHDRRPLQGARDRLHARVERRPLHAGAGGGPADAGPSRACPIGPS